MGAMEEPACASFTYSKKPEVHILKDKLNTTEVTG